ncbi:MAG: tRNA pseudouridine(38-40) synthase TruA [Candidatus Thiodiazotropha sp. (ex Dulcina madagascariensis)]|nr:tRNA pseudouridine(38-40) synthase TruA [Candidatus Thiodiazotropha sp. (ex Dulcina madagascariensis)]
MKIALGVEYDGSAFHGWQFQGDVRSVQELLQLALSKVADHEITVHCAGRTDSGVHASGQVVHFETHARRSARSWVLGSNVNLPDDISVCWAREMPDAFHARFSAVGRHYRYLILNRAFRSALWRNRAVWVHQPLDEIRMHRAAQALVGTHDFSSYRALGCQAKHPVRTLHSLTVRREGEMIAIEVHANAFLHHMVRNIAGVLLAIGKGEQAQSWAEEILGLRDRTLGGVTAPPQGLYLTKVDYPAEFGLRAC